MRAYIKLWGNEYLIESISWYGGGSIAHVTFCDENNVLHTVFNGIESLEDNRRDEIKESNFKESVFWAKK